MPTIRFPIVGASFRPPAADILAVLPIGTTLILRPEPENPHDPRAKAVWILTADISNEAFVALDDGRLAKHGMMLSDLGRKPEWPLGYIPAAMAKTFTLPDEIFGRFSLSGNGAPRITVDLP